MCPIISPSILACDFAHIAAELTAIEQEKSGQLWHHLDIMDGHFVPNLTFGLPLVKRIHQVATRPLDAHLMVTNPKFHMQQMQQIGLHNITFHQETATEAKTIELIQWAKQKYPSVGISIKPQTPVDQLSDSVLQSVDLVLVMSVEPGFGGQLFMASSLQKIATLTQRRHSLACHFAIQVDGGINHITAPQAITAGADNLVAGSYIFCNPPETYPQKIYSLQSIAPTTNPH